jgi:hypothetical protein
VSLTREVIKRNVPTGMIAIDKIKLRDGDALFESNVCDNKNEEQFTETEGEMSRQTMNAIKRQKGVAMEERKSKT